jgi:hypothetical protein
MNDHADAMVIPGDTETPRADLPHQARLPWAGSTALSSSGRHLLIKSDARRIPLADRSVQCCVTSPPYFGLRDYGVAGQLGLESTPDAYVAEMVRVFRDVRRVLRDDGTLWLNIGDSYNAHRHPLARRLRPPGRRLVFT